MEEKRAERVDHKAQEKEKERIEREREVIAEMSGEPPKKGKEGSKKQKR